MKYFYYRIPILHVFDWIKSCIYFAHEVEKPPAHRKCVIFSLQNCARRIRLNALILSLKLGAEAMPVDLASSKNIPLDRPGVVAIIFIMIPLCLDRHTVMKKHRKFKSFFSNKRRSNLCTNVLIT